MIASAGAATRRRIPSGIGVGTVVLAPGLASEPGWLKAARRRAAAWVEANGFPTTKHEDWRCTRLDAVVSVPLTASSGGSAEDGSVSLVSGYLPEADLGGPRIVVANGRLVPELSAVGEAIAGGARVDSLAGALGVDHGRLGHSWARHSGGYPHALRALNDAAAPDAVVIDLPPGTVVHDPIEVVFVSMPVGGARWSHPRLIVDAGEGATATIVETYLSIADGSSVTNALTQVDLAVGAEVVHYVLQGESLDCFHFSSLEGHLAENSRLSSRLVAAGGRIGRHEVDVVLAGEGSQVDLDGLFLTGTGQHHDNPVLVDHAAPGCTSRQLYKGVVSDNGHGVFNGHIVVRPGADGTDAAQVNKNLLLSERAEVDTRPRLEINADDVACSHGAAVGQLDPDALFYLRSRGVPEREAQAILVSGFAREVLDRFAPGQIRQRAEQLAKRAGVVALKYPGHAPGTSTVVSGHASDALRGGPRT
jgi:Fe-S cluster assembly protein SufD